ncbi:hypothetical protein PHMEG_00030662 [Phytophthora megakarya]|uniref:Chromo domain-containing protein n=1 Tax=Phytophthora megakarya TaxID=4795 RepID=A0A225V0I9_9STRA|nr:hypothetical protein PHMEG_00030662 [Phytophthora megakarya]
MDTTRKETSFFVAHGWYAQTTLKAMSSSLKRGLGRQSDALAWRREVNRQQEIALKMAKEYQATEKARRAKKHNESLRGLERGTASETGRTVTRSDERPATGAVTEDSDANATGATRSLFEVGSRVWLYIERVKPGLTKKLAHRWHRPEDSWEPDHVAGEFEVEAILDDRTPLSTSTERAIREFKVKWVSYDDPTWEPASNLSCGGLLYDYLEEKRRDRRLQMVQVADED